MKEQLEYIRPEQIEHRSMELIGQELAQQGIVLDPELEPVIKRVIHTSADFDYAKNLCFSAHVVQKARQALRDGADIVTDTYMAMAGINQKSLGRFGGQVHCFMREEEVAREAQARGITRAAVSMERAAQLPGKLVFAIGNAPTALIRLCELIEQGKLAPALVIGVPVGFVNVVESKERIMNSGAPYIVARGRKGGSNIAAAIVNALLYGMT